MGVDRRMKAKSASFNNKQQNDAKREETINKLETEGNNLNPWIIGVLLFLIIGSWLFEIYDSASNAGEEE